MEIWFACSYNLLNSNWCNFSKSLGHLVLAIVQL